MLSVGIERAASWSRATAGRMRRWTVARVVGWGRAMGRILAWALATAQVCGRLLAAFVLGALVGPYADVGLRVPADIAFRLSVAVLLLPVLGVVLAEMLARRRWIAVGVCALVLVVVAEAVARFVAADPHADWVPLVVVAQWLSLLLAPVAAGFVLGGPRPGARAIGVAGGAGLAAWAGVGVHHLWLAERAGTFADAGPAGALGKPLLIFLLVIFIVEVPAAALGGLLAGAIRVRLSRVPLWEQSPGAQASEQKARAAIAVAPAAVEAPVAADVPAVVSVPVVEAVALGVTVERQASIAAQTIASAATELPAETATVASDELADGPPLTDEAVIVPLASAVPEVAESAPHALPESEVEDAPTPQIA